VCVCSVQSPFPSLLCLQIPPFDVSALLCKSTRLSVQHYNFPPSSLSLHIQLRSPSYSLKNHTVSVDNLLSLPPLLAMLLQ
jgi:hypothetical protein